MEAIFLRQTESYEQELVNRQVRQLFQDLQVGQMLTPASHVVLKVNLIAGRRPEECATTHPAVVRGMCLALRELGVKNITIADSPGGPFTAEALNHIYKVSGMTAIEQEGLAVLNRDTSWDTVFAKPGLSCRSFTRINVVKEADFLINLPKLKTHAMMMFTCGIKNNFGTIPGLQKPEMHYRYPNTQAFARMLVELAADVAPALTLIDAVDGMEGDGPTGGTPRHLGFLMASRDLFTMDYLAATLAGLAPDSLPLLSEAKAMGYVAKDASLDKIQGDTGFSLLKAPLQPPLLLPETHDVLFASFLPSFLRKPFVSVASALFHAVPKVNPALCVGCGKCAESCPQKLITIGPDHKAHFESKGCISCFCCQEMCPQKAIRAKRRLSI